MNNENNLRNCFEYFLNVFSYDFSHFYFVILLIKDL